MGINMSCIVNERIVKSQ